MVSEGSIKRSITPSQLGIMASGHDVASMLVAGFQEQVVIRTISSGHGATSGIIEQRW